jgi:hypothetical protein
LVDPKGKVVEMLSDADALVFCLENFQGRIEQDGF